MSTSYPIESGSASTGIRKEVIDNLLKIYAQPSYVLKNLLSTSTTGGWQNTYYAEDPAVLTAPTGNSTKGIPRGANFPQMSTSNIEKTGWITKYGAEDNITYEDILANNVNKQARTIFKLTQKLVYDLDSDIYTAITSDANTQTFTIAANSGWDHVASTAIVDDLMYALQLIGTYNYPTSNVTAAINLRDYRSIMAWVTAKGAQWNQLSNSVAENGSIGKLAGVNLVVTASIPASRALVVVPKVCANWKELVPLQSQVIEDPYKSTTIRVVNEGMIEVTDPRACVLIKGTQWTA